MCGSSQLSSTSMASSASVKQKSEHNREIEEVIDQESKRKQQEDNLKRYYMNY